MVSARTSGTSAGDRVREAALDLFSERGFHGTGIRQLAEHAGLSSASLYHYMGTKEDLLVSLMRESLESLLADTGALSEVEDPGERIAALVRLHVTSHAVRPRETRVVDDEVRALSAGNRAEVVALRDRYEAVWQRALDEGAAAGAWPADPTGVTRRALLEMCSGVARWFDPTGPAPLSVVVEEYVRLAAQMLGAARTTRRPDQTDS